ncbi:MAG: alpha-1,2-fucosyltransferase [Alphaproteobacteria bacterium]|nr:alpha-1,2-fucosyltransferase [Alphaproteobacteria bacterium]
MTQTLINKLKKVLFCFFVVLCATFFITEIFFVKENPYIFVEKFTSTYEVKPHEVVVNLYGGLGNNMFQYATAFSYAKKHNKILKVRRTTPRIFNSFLIPENIILEENPKYQKAFFERGSKQNFEQVMGDDSFQYLDGYFQNEAFFKEYREDILNEFKLKKELNSVNKNLAKKMNETNSVAVHIRRGDYLRHFKNDVLSNHYYLLAMDYIASKVDNPFFYIFSDDVKWVKNNLKVKYNHMVVENNRRGDAVFDMYLMSLCKHNIIANSTFSWWGAWLNQNKDKIVIAPRVWLSRKKAYEDTKNVIPNNWIRIKEKADVGIIKIGKFTEEEKKNIAKYFLPFDRKNYFEYEKDTDISKDLTKLNKLDYIFVLKKEIIFQKEINYNVVPDAEKKYLIYNRQKKEFENARVDNFDMISTKGSQIEDVFH